MKTTKNNGIKTAVILTAAGSSTRMGNGKKKEFLSIPYQSVACFSVETAGTFDEDAEMKLWVRGMSEPIEINFGPGTDMVELQKLIAEHILK